MTKDTPTPRVDAFVARFDADPDAAYVEVLDFARELGHDLTACRAALRKIAQDADGALVSGQRTYGLQTALGAIRAYAESAARAILQSDEGEKS